MRKARRGPLDWRCHVTMTSGMRSDFFGRNERRFVRPWSSNGVGQRVGGGMQRGTTPAQQLAHTKRTQAAERDRLGFLV